MSRDLLQEQNQHPRVKTWGEGQVNPHDHQGMPVHVSMCAYVLLCAWVLFLCTWESRWSMPGDLHYHYIF